MFGKKTKKHFGIKILIAFLVSIIPTYLVSTLGVMYLNKDTNKPNINEYTDYLSNFNLVIDRTFELFPPYTPLLLMGLFTIAICYLIQGILFEEKGYEEADDVGIHGTSKWGNPDELRNGKTLAKKGNSNYGNNLKKNLDMENGYILGKVPDKKGLTIMHDNTDVDNQNVVVLGSSGAGKTQSYVIPNIINVKNKSIIVTDPKGELFELTSQLKRDQGYKTYQVDFVHFKQAKYNPLYYVETALDAQKIANTIITNFEKGGEGGSGQFFKNSATNILSALIVYVKTEYDKDEANLEKVVDVYDEHVQDEEHFLKWVDTIPKSHPAKDLLNSIKELTDVTRKSVTSTLSNGFSLFKLPEVKSMTQTSDFDFEDFIEEKAILYVKLSMEDNTFAPLTSVFFNQMLNIYYQIAQESPDNKLKRKVVFMLDEFANIGKLDNYSRVLATCRSLGLSMHTIIQNKAQLEDKKMYGKDESLAILSNHDTTVLLRAKDTDTVTTKWFSEALGDTTISQKKNDMTKSKGGISKQIGDNYLKRPLMTPSEIAGLSKKECIVLISGHDPLFLDKAFQGEVYPNLITKKVKENGKIKFKYNYDNIRESLGYTDPVMKEESYNVEKQVTFSEIRDVKHQKEDETNNTKAHEMNREQDSNESTENPNNKSNDNKKYKLNKSFDDVLNRSGMKNEIEKVSESIAESYLNGDDSMANLLKETKDSLIEHANEDDQNPFNELDEDDKDITVEATTKESVNKFKNQAISNSDDIDLPM
ncbi:type IV secretory system conjugative DNA transfer family protein [Staphylococcus saprophyticus]|uniref:VirD4-like conjugal transfer protein, CD1115 family n=1 Tax=Staphylococcus saprophyticus TaxID=29385 RepID=UPI002DB59936|nr:type IV secretory system conjugative DNA transfer family protein [Staphylococcus saprophyticus]MEB7678033.1 type IV secretory system conjugative DNA transfer family protein [Staphylococcus saprophyticus]